MINHIVMWTITDKYEKLTKHEIVEKIKIMIENLPKHIPQLRKVEVGINFNNSDAAGDVVLYSEFDSVEDLEIYQEHPEHKKVAAFISNVRISRMVVDYKK
jgi:hypothetical protein